MKFSFDVPAYWPDLSQPAHKMYADLLETARAADQMGFIAITIPEHHFINYFTMPAPLVFATHLAAHTKSARIVVAVIVLPFHDVRLLAGEVNVVDQLTHGRLEIGLGSGGAGYEFVRMGIDPKQARQIFDEKRVALIKLLTEKDVTFDGQLVQVPQVTIMPPPYQRPHAPLWVAAMRPESAYHLARQGVNVQSTTLRQPLEKAEAVIKAFHEGAEQCAAATKPRLSFFRWVFVTESDSETREVLRLGIENESRFRNLVDTEGDVRGGEVQPVGTAHTEDTLREASIVGTAQECVDRLKLYENWKVDELNVRMHFGASHAMVMRSLERFHADVMPHFTPGA